MSNYLITSETKNKNYLVALEDDFGFVPLWATNDFDVALGLLKCAESEKISFTNQTERLMEAS